MVERIYPRNSYEKVRIVIEFILNLYKKVQKAIGIIDKFQKKCDNHEQMVGITGGNFQ